MIYRYLKRKKWKLLLIFISLGFLYIMTDGFGSSSIPIETYDIPKKKKFCPFCPSEVPVTTQEPEISVDIISHLHLRQAFLSLNETRLASNSGLSEDPVCTRPNVDLNHDSVKYAFFPMKKLNCSKEELFSIKNNVFTLNSMRLGDRELGKCLYAGIERITDEYYQYTESLTITSPPFDIILKHDFVRIKCYLKTDEDEDDELDDNNEENLTARKLLSRKTKVGSVAHIRSYNSINKKSFLADFAETSLYLNSTQNKDKTFPSNVSKKQQTGHFLNSSNTLHANLHGISINKSYPVFVNETSGRFMVKKLYWGRAEESHKSSAKHIGRSLLYESEDKDADGDDIEEEDSYGDMYMYDPFENTWYDDTADFDQLLVQVSPKPEVFQRIAGIVPKTDFQARPNILMFGLDSLSHLSFQRKLPKTYKYLQDDLGAVILDGYNIVGDATTAALIPILTGKTEMELPEARRDIDDSDTVDRFPFMWKAYRKQGYVTMFSEDEPTISVFNLRLNGFKHVPTDHYMRPFWQALWDTPMRKDSPRYCTGNVPNHMYLLQYTKDFFDKYANVSKFAFVFGSELTHWNNNPGEYMDVDFVQMLEYFKKKHYLDNTILIVYADHGARYSIVRNTIQGKMEERLPMMSLTFPKWFHDKYPDLIKNLRHNSNKLTTPFDIHETLSHILDLHSHNPRPKQKPSHRGISLLEPVPFNRTCASAHIEMHWCMCLKQVALDVTDKHVQKSVNALVDFINKETEKLRNLCAKLTFKSLQHAYLLLPNEKVLMFQKSKDSHNRVAKFNSSISVDHAHFQITIETSPNKGLYESTVQVNMTGGTYTVLETQISRLDRYGLQPACIQDKYPMLRKYCYCRVPDNKAD